MARRTDPQVQAEKNKKIEAAKKVMSKIMTTIIPLKNIGIDKGDLRWPTLDEFIILYSYKNDKYDQTRNMKIPIKLADDLCANFSAVRNQDELEDLLTLGPVSFRKGYRRPRHTQPDVININKPQDPEDAEIKSI